MLSFPSCNYFFLNAKSPIIFCVFHLRLCCSPHQDTSTRQYIRRRVRDCLYLPSTGDMTVSKRRSAVSALLPLPAEWTGVMPSGEMLYTSLLRLSAMTQCFRRNSFSISNKIIICFCFGYSARGRINIGSIIAKNILQVCSTENFWDFFATSLASGKNMNISSIAVPVFCMRSATTLF